MSASESLSLAQLLVRLFTSETRELGVVRRLVVVPETRQSREISTEVTASLAVVLSRLVLLSLQLSLSVDLEIELPEVVGEEGGGFNTDISDWIDETVDIPM